MKEKNNSNKNIAKIAVAIVTAVILGGMLFFFIIDPIILRARVTKHTQMYFQALQENDIQTASQYIDWPNIESSSPEWLEKISGSQESIIIHSINNDFRYKNDGKCIIRVSYNIVATVNDENVEFSDSVMPSPYCPNSLTFGGLRIPYAIATGDSESVKDARFFISSDVTR